MRSRILFESVLRDAIFVPVGSASEANVISVQFLDGLVSHVRSSWREGYWTLKFDNGAILPIWSGAESGCLLWWIGEMYRVSELDRGLSAQRVQDPALRDAGPQSREDWETKIRT